MKSFFYLFCMFIPAFCLSQEFRGKVVLNSQQIQSSDRRAFEQLQQSLNDFVYNRTWTNLSLNMEERLDCNLSMVLKSQSSQNEYVGQLTIQLSRPVYNSTYTTGLFNFVESDFSFSFNENQALNFEASTFYTNLSSTLGYYMYLLLGIYFDSFSLNGGTPFFDKADMVVQTAGNSGYAGWRSSEKNTRNRFWILENFTNPRYAPLREAMYLYHRKGLDMMSIDQVEARKNIISALRLIQKVNKDKPNLASVQIFMEAKMNELLSVFQPASSEEQEVIVEIVRETSPLNVQKLKGFSGNK